MPTRIVLFCSLLLAATLACGAKSASDTYQSADQPASSPPVAIEEAPARVGGRTPALASAVERKLIRQASMSLRVGDTDATADEIRRLVTDAGGYVADVSSHLDGELRYYNLTVRVPGARLDPTLAEIRLLADEVLREHIGTQDVTAQFVDLEARLTALTATETELRGLLAESRERKHGAEDIMAIYRHLTEIRTQVESLQGQMNLLSNQIDFATVHLDLAPTESAKPMVARGWRPLETVRNSVRQLIANLSAVGDLVIRFLIAALPILAIAAALFWGLLRLVGRFSASARATRRGNQ